MKKDQIMIFLHLLVLLLIGNEAEGRQYPHSHSNHADRKLFVFGDSYVDTGNYPISAPFSPWKEPYGITFPGKPVGRFSDGRVLTDYVASFMGIPTPVAYRWRNLKPNATKYGINFAVGGAGVFDTYFIQPNLTVQIDSFETLIAKSLISQGDVKSSIVLVSIVGNDYGAYALRHGSSEGSFALIAPIVKKLIEDLDRLYHLGVRKVAVNSVMPFGCLPANSVNSSCSEERNRLSREHNKLLEREIQKLKKKRQGLKIIILDLYSAFLNSWKQHQQRPREWKFENPLKPCCEGISKDFSCGQEDEKGVKKYTVCTQPKKAFFWDTTHPTQQGWFVVSTYLKPYVNQLISLQEI